MLALRPLRAIRAIPSPLGPLSACRNVHTTLPRFKDPWPLPLDPSTVQREQYAPARLSDDPESWDMPQPIERKGEDEETMRARLVYQTRKRGCLEGDLLLATFARDRLGGMKMDEMREFDKILDEPDWDIFYWSVGKKEAPERWRDSAILKELQQHAKNEGKVVRMMPALSNEARPSQQ